MHLAIHQVFTKLLRRNNAKCQCKPARISTGRTPGDILSEQGVEYEVRLVDQAGNIMMYSSNYDSKKPNDTKGMIKET